MSGMMNAKRYTGCRCCTDPNDVARRQIEKREAEAEILEELNDIAEDNLGGESSAVE